MAFPELDVGGNDFAGGVVCRHGREASQVAVAPAGGVLLAGARLIGVTQRDHGLVRQVGLEPEPAPVGMELLGHQRTPEVVQREKSADAIVEGAEALVAEVDGADVDLADVELREVILRPGEGPAIEHDGRFPVIQLLAVVQVLDAAAAIGRLPRPGLKGRGVARDIGRVARDLDVTFKVWKRIGLCRAEAASHQDQDRDERPSATRGECGVGRHGRTGLKT